MSNYSDYQYMFHQDFKSMDPSLVFGLIIVTLGIYIIPWMYIKNKELALIDQNAPDATRGIVVISMIPFLWGYGTYIFRKLIFDHPSIIAIQIIGWSFSIFLILKYIYDFCQTFGRITKTSGFAWFFITLIPFLGIPAMQAELNSHFNRIIIRKKYYTLYK